MGVNDILSISHHVSIHFNFKVKFIELQMNMIVRFLLGRPVFRLVIVESVILTKLIMVKINFKLKWFMFG
jgi:hypothetical protein